LSYLIRPMQREDIPQVADIDREAFPTQWPPPNYRHELELQLAHYLVAIDDTEILSAGPSNPENPGSLIGRLQRWLGFGGYEPEAQVAKGQNIVGFAGIWVMADEAHVTNIAVRKRYQRRGLGKRLLLALMDLSNQLNASFMTLEVRTSNTAAQSLYKKFGFRNVGTRRCYYLDNREDAVLMSTESMTSTSFQEKFHYLKQTILE